MMTEETTDQIVDFFKGRNKFLRLIERYLADSSDNSLLFELLFAYWLEKAGYDLQYEVNVNPENNYTVDFYLGNDGSEFFFELLRIENMKEIQEHISQQQQQDEPFRSYELSLGSDEENTHFTTAAQTIRLQEKLLEKATKFPPIKNNRYFFIVVDCSTVHLGHIDDDDIRIAMFGRPRNPVNQEHFQGNRVKGMYESDFNKKGIVEFRERVGCIIFLRELKPGGLSGSYAVGNPYMEQDYLEKMGREAIKIGPLEGIRLIKPAS